MTEAAQVSVSAPKPDRRLKVRGFEHTMRRQQMDVQECGSWWIGVGLVLGGAREARRVSVRWLECRESITVWGFTCQSLCICAVSVMFVCVCH